LCLTAAQRKLKHTLWGLMAGRHRTQHGVITQSSTPTSDVKRVLDALNLKPPKRYLELPRPSHNEIHHPSGPSRARTA
jgi:hypothetical protein